MTTIVIDGDMSYRLAAAVPLDWKFKGFACQGLADGNSCSMESNGLQVIVEFKVMFGIQRTSTCSNNSI